MSNIIDSKTVEMLFDNSNFEKNVQTSLSSLDKLKKSLNMDGVTDGLGKVASEAKGINFNFFGDSVDTVKGKFSALEQVAIGALRRIGEQAVEAGEQFVKSLTIDQVTAGWNKYAEKTSSVQTIMAATRKEFAGAENQMELVNDQLDRLNWFTDETSYNFLDMVNNVGKFTSNNIPLGQSIEAMQGIATWAAVSGANAQEASRAMYNMSQALSVGSVKLMDWKSIENANMATAEFKETAIETAIALGKLKKDEKTGDIYTVNEKGQVNKNQIVSVEKFNQELSSGWFNKEVLLKTLESYGGFANKLYDYTNETGSYASEFLGYLKDYQDGSLDMAEVVKETGISSERLTEIFEDLSKDEYELGNRAFRAAQEAKTFQEAIDATKDAASTGFMNIFESIFGNYEEAKVLWTKLANELYDVVVEPINDMGDMIDNAMSGTTLETYMSRMTGLSGEASTNLVKLAREVGVNSEEFKKLNAELFDGDPRMQKLVENVLGAATGMEEFSKTDFATEIAKMTGKSQMFANELFKVGEEAGYDSDQFKDLALSMADGDKEMANTIINLAKMSAEMDGLSGRERLIKSFWNIWKYVGEVIAPIKEAFDNIFPPVTASRLFDLTKKIESFTDSLKVSEDEANRIRRVFEGFFSIFKIGKQILDAVLIPIKDLFARISENSESIGETVAGWADWVTELADSGKVAETLTSVFTKVSDIVQRAVDFVVDFFNISKTIKSYYEAGGGIAGVFKVIGDKVGSVVSLVFDEISKITGIDLSGAKEKVLTFLSNIEENVMKFLPTQEQLVEGWGKLKEMIANVKAKISEYLPTQEALKEGWEKFKEIVGIVKDRIKVFLPTKDELIEGWKKLKEVLGLVTKPLKDIIAVIKAKFAAKGFENFRDVLDAIKEKLTGVSDKLSPFKKVMESIKKVASSLWGFLKKLAPLISNIVDSAGTLFSAVLDGLGNFISNVDLSKLGEIVALGAGAFAGFNIGDFFGSLSEAVEGFGTTLEKILKSTRKLIDAYTKDVKAGTLLKVAAAIGILALSLSVIAGIDPDKLIASTGAMIILMTTMSSMMKGMDGLKIKTSTAISFIAVAAAMLLIAGALKKLEEVSWESILKGIVAFGIIMKEIASTLKKMPNPAKSLGNAMAMLLVSVALVLIAQSLKPFEEISWESIFKGIVAFGAIMLEIALVLKLMPNPAKSLGNALSMVIVAAALLIIAQAIKPFGDIEWGSILKGIVTFGVVMAEIAVALRLMPNGAKSLANAISMVIVAASLLIIAQAIKPFGDIEWGSILKGIVAFGAVLAEIAIATKVMGATSVLSAVGILITVAALALMVPVLKALGGMSWEEIGKGLLTIAGVFVILGTAGYLLAPIVGVIIALAAALVLIGVATIAFGAGMLVISLALTALSTSAEIAAKAIVDILNVIITSLPMLATNLAEAVGAMLPALISMLSDTIYAVLEATKTMVPELVDTLLTILGEVLTSLGANIQSIIEGLIQIVVGILKGLAAGIPDMIEATVEIFRAVIDGLTASLGSLDPAALLEAIVALGLLTVAMGLIVGIAAMALVATLTLPTIGTNLSNFIENVKPFIEGISAVDPASLQGAKTLAETVLILTAAGILDALTSWFTGGSSIVSFGQQIAEFAPYMKSYADSISGIDAGVVEASANAGKALAEMASAIPNEGGLVSLFAGDNSLTAFGPELVSFGGYMAEYSAAVSGKIDAEAITASANAGKAIAEMANALPNQGGVVSWFTGDNSLDQIGKQLKPFGESMAEYSAAVSGKIDAEAVSASVNAAKSISEMASNLPNQGGVVSWFTGDNSLADIAKQLKPFGEAIAEYSSAVAGKVDADAISASVNAAKSISGLAEALPNQGGVVSWFEGDNSLGKIAEQLKPFGEAMADYSASVSGKIDQQSIRSSVNAAKLISGMAAELPNQGGTASWFEGDNTLAKIAEQLKPFGVAMADYSAAVSGNIDEAAITASVNAAKLISGIASELPNQGGMDNWFSGQNTLGSFGEGLNSLGANLVAYSHSVKDLDTASMGKANRQLTALSEIGKTISEYNATSISSFVQAMEDVANAGMDGFISAIEEGTKSIIKSISDTISSLSKALSGGESEVVEAVKTLESSMVGVFDSTPDTFEKIGTSMSKAIDTGFESYKETIKVTATSVVTETAKACRNNSARLLAVQAGEYLGDGFASGIKNKKNAAFNAAVDLANSAANGLNKALAINSPSKVTAKTGMYFGLGFVDNLLDFADKAYNSAEELGESAAKGLNDAVKKAYNNSLVAGDDPITIRPVLDLTEIQNGANEIYGMMSGLNGYSIAGTARLAGSVSAGINSPYNTEASTEMSKLTDSIKELISTNGSTQNNTFNISGTTDPEEVAERVADILSQQLKRRDALWA